MRFVSGNGLGVVTLYWLNGSLEEDVVRQQIGALQTDGFSGIAPLPLSRRKPSTRPIYLSEEYFELYHVMLDELSSRGMQLVLYDDCDFPSGTAGGMMREKYPELMSKYLVEIDTILYGGHRVRVPMPNGKLMSGGFSDPNENSTYKVITKEMSIVSADAEHTFADFDLPAGRWRVRLYVCVVDPRYKLVDCLDPEAVKTLMDLTYEEYAVRFGKYFGTTIHTTFYDDLSYFHVPGGRMWTSNFNERFEETYGYSPERFYPALFGDMGEHTGAMRVALFGFRDRLFSEGYPNIVSRWAKKNGISCSGHPAGTYRPNPIQCLGDGIGYFQWQDIPLCDYIHYFRHGIDGFKIPTSATYNYDKSLLACEIYGNFKPMEFNDAKMLYRAGMDMYARGINQLLSHGTWYDADSVSINPEISWRNPKMAESLFDYNQWVSRCEMILQDSRHVSDIAVLYPIDDLRSRYNYHDYTLTNGKEPIRGNNYYDLLGMLTCGVRIDYTLLHPQVLDEKCIVEQGTLKLDNTNNFESYRVVILPWCETVRFSNLQKLREFTNRGGVVLALGCLPIKSAEYGKNEQVERLVSEMYLEGRLKFISDPKCENIISFLDGVLDDRIVRVKNISKVDIPETCSMLPDVFNDTAYAYNYIHKVKEGKDFFFFANPTDCTLSAELEFDLESRHDPQLWDPHTGRIESLPFDRKSDKIHITLPLDPVKSCFVVFD